MNANGVSLSLSGKIALITGGSRGIGAATVKMFVAAGAKVAFSYQRSLDEASSVVRECGEENCFAIQSDLNGLGGARELVEAAVAKFNRLDVLVANHGVWPPDEAPVDEMTEEQWARTLGINLDSVFALVKYAVVQMKRKERNSETSSNIVLISSTAGQRGEAMHCDYAATKGAVISMTKGLSTELAPFGILVNCVAPGWVDTRMASPALEIPAERQKVYSTIPLGRVARPEEIAGAVLFLCSPLASFITGEILNVNGGAVLVG